VRLPGGGTRAWRALVALAAALGAVAAISAQMARAGTNDPPYNVTPNPTFYNDCAPNGYDDSSACVNDTVAAIDHARAQEGVGSLTLPTNWYSLSVPQQIFVITNLERTARGLPPMEGMATQADQSAQQAAQQDQDPTPPSGWSAPTWAGNWAGGGSNPLEIDYFWMYYDGPNSNNEDCSSAGQPGCWVHRHGILAPMQCSPCVNGAGYAPTASSGNPSWTDLLIDTSGSPALDFSWSQESGALPSDETGNGGGSVQNGAAKSAPSQSSSSSGAAAPAPPGHRMVEANGGVFDFGGDAYYGSLPGLGINVDDIIAMASTADRRGYWLLGSDGGMFAFGDATYYGSVPGTGARVDDIVGFAPTPDGKGYWVVGADGGMFAFGDATFYGSLPGRGQVVDDVTGFTPSPDGHGYLVAERGGQVWNFGDSGFYGSPALSGYRVDIVGIAAAPGYGYWLVGSDGGIFNYGLARYEGSVPGAGAHVGNVVSIAPTPDGQGYWITGSDGGLFAFGDANYFGSLPGLGIHVNDVRMGTPT